jgi:hypothetical protein
MNKTTLVSRMLAADPARAISVDETARLQVLTRLVSEPRQARGASWRQRVRRRLSRPMILIPALLVLSGAAVGTEPAWCAPCRGAADPAATSSLVVGSPSRSAVTWLLPGKYGRARAQPTAKYLARRNPA